LGTVECRGLAAAIEAADAMAKTARVSLAEFQMVGSGLVAVVVGGDVAAVKAAVDAGVAAAGRVGEVVSSNVIPRPADAVGRLLG
jgi:microcompartment protein CcmL/EutN